MELWFHFFLFPRITERTLKVKRVLKVEKRLLIQKTEAGIQWGFFFSRYIIAEVTTSAHACQSTSLSMISDSFLFVATLATASIRSSRQLCVCWDVIDEQRIQSFFFFARLI